MAGMAAKMVSAYFETQDAKVEELKDDLLRIRCSIQGGSVDIFLKFDETDTHVHLEGINFIKVPEDRYDNVYKVLNECNGCYIHVKFVLDTERGQIFASEDDVIQLDSCGKECFELMIRMIKTVEDTYPKFMKAIWA